MKEGKKLVERRLADLDRLSDDALSEFDQNPVDEIVTSPSGKRFRVQVEASSGGSGEWDDDPELSVSVRAKGLGRARWQRYVGEIDRHESVRMKRFSGPGEVTREGSHAGAALVVAAFLLATVGVWVVGLAYLVVLLVRFVF